jgi:hypothetical protein
MLAAANIQLSNSFGTCTLGRLGFHAGSLPYLGWSIWSDVYARPPAPAPDGSAT